MSAVGESGFLTAGRAAAYVGPVPPVGSGAGGGSGSCPLEEFDDDLLLGPGGRGANATAPCRPVNQVGRCRAASVRRVRVGAGAE